LDLTKRSDGNDFDFFGLFLFILGQSNRVPKSK
jgi:hypothetical protein